MSKRKSYRITTIFIAFTLLLSACGGRAADATVEVFSWWTEGGEASGLQAMIQVFNETYPDIEFINAAAAEDVGPNARRVLSTRLQAGNPPDSWQGHAGQELIGTYVPDEQIVPLNDLYKQEDWLESMPMLLFPLISQDGNIYSIPVSIQRTNLLWYNPSVLEANNISVPTTIDEWFAFMDTLQGTDIIPLALGDQTSRMHLLETILLASLGPEQYAGLWDESTDWAGPEVTAALALYQQALTYASSDADSADWQDAAQQIANGEAAFLITGDWADGYFRELGKDPDTDYGWVPAPGTDGLFQFMADSFVLATNAPNREAAIAWLTIAGSRQGQEAFNPVRGSICARTDCDPALFNEYQQSAMEDWANHTLAGSLAYGVVANDAWKAEINTALRGFAPDDDLAAFQASLVEACETAGACKEEEQ